ncbi:hypothetical protein GJAV_G00251760 [Gymnothorax javanicus]|nr:hypothetical protein GJAV_G00251760 [Gymnothorax javanicus]
MDQICVTVSLLLLLIVQAQGATYFLYWGRDEPVIMRCEGKGWVIDHDYDDEVDCHFILKDKGSEESSEEKSECQELKKYKNTLKRCTNENWKNCIIVKNPQEINGVFACVYKTGLKLIHPFINTNKNDYFILAFKNLDVLESSFVTEKHLHIDIQEGEPIFLTCNFSISPNFSTSPYIVYWIKISDKGSTCVYSYNYDHGYEIHHNYYRHIGNNLLTRISNSTAVNPRTFNHNHDLTIINATHSDSGQYLCALNVIKNKGNWVVISNVTVATKRTEHSNTNTTQDSKGKFIPYLGICLGVASLVAIGVLAIGIYLKKKTIITKESQPESKQRHENGDETSHPDISPYAEAGREFEPYSVVSLTAQPADEGAKGDRAKHQNEPYSIVGVTPQGNVMGRSSQEDQKRKHREKRLDTGAHHVYDRIDDTYSTCK